MRIDFASYSNIGSRNVNEDSSLVKTYDGATLAAVADGLGGHGGGDIASSRALERLDELAGSEFPRTEEAFKKVCLALNDAVLGAQTDRRHMKTTLAMAAVTEDTLACVHIGDSRIYYFSGGKIRYQSTDHSVSQLAVLSGEITSDQIRFHEDRSKLLRSLGSEEAAAPDIRIFDHVLQPGDAVLLCSDGFWEYVLEKEMLHTLARTRTAEDWLSGMIQSVKKRTRGVDNDNNTAVVVRFFQERRGAAKP
jgi:serine/threonine protein phosphatase PrpC